jgi:hypothetical protein
VSKVQNQTRKHENKKTRKKKDNQTGLTGQEEWSVGVLE